MANRNPESGIGTQRDDPRSGGMAANVSRREGALSDRQAIDGDEDDDLGAGSEAEMHREGARSTPPMGDVRSDANAGAGPGNGEPL